MTALKWELGSKESKEVWQKRWDDKTENLPYTNWDNFRNDPKIMEGLDTNPNYFLAYLASNTVEAVPLSLCTEIGVGNPLGEYIDGQFYSADTLRFGRYIHNIKKYLTFKRIIRVAEIGCGYGGFALNFVKHIKVASYTLIDVEPCRSIQEKYLGITSDFPFNYATVSAERQDEIGEVDLIISTNSLGEMPKEDIDRFFGWIQTKLVSGGIFYSNNMEEPSFSYPYDDKWHFPNVVQWGPSVWERVSIRL